MSFASREDKLEEIIEAHKDLLPADFDYQIYLDINPDLIDHNISTKNLATAHYLVFGINEKRKYKPETFIQNIDIDFDENFYLHEYPDVRDYYSGEYQIPIKEKLFHHYCYYGKKEGRFKNKIDKMNALVDTGGAINNYIDDSQLIYFNNNLECICLLTTSKEIANGKCYEFLDHLLAKTQKNKISKNIHFKITINNNNTPFLFKNLHKLKQLFANVELINLDLPINEDIYVSKLKENQALPKLGLKSGPNICFFKTIELCKEYNTSLLLETDCLLGYDWLTKIYNYTKYANGFLISGAIYDGSVCTRSESAMMNHINGGTALYATSNPVLQNLIKLLEEFLAKQVAHNMPGLAYDYALKLMIDRNLDQASSSSKDRNIWQFIYRNYFPNKLIFNYSSEPDSNYHQVPIFQKHNYAILHKKSMNKNTKIAYTYYEVIDKINNCSSRSYKQEDLINICKQSWLKNGWEFIVLNYDTAKQHKFYKEYSSIVSSLPSVNPEKYDYHCYMRWLAMAEVGGGLMIDYDVMNLSLRTDELFKNQTRLSIFQNHVPCVVYGSAEDYLLACQEFCRLKDNQKCISIVNTKPHTSDMVMVAHGFDANIYNKIKYVTDYPIQAPLVHCSQRFCSENNKNKLEAMFDILTRKT